MRQALTLIVWLLLAGGLGPAAAEERLVPSWMTIDAGAKAVAMDVIAVKIGALVRTSVRHIKIAMASACPYQTEYHLAYLYLKRAAF